MIGLIGWGGILTAIIAWESISLVSPHDHWPTVSDMLRQVTRPAFGRWLLFALWLWLGWHLFVMLDPDTAREIRDHLTRSLMDVFSREARPA